MFRPGDEVVCIETMSREEIRSLYGCDGGDGMKKGQAFTVEAVVVDHYGATGLVISGKRSAHPTGGYLASAFRKVQRKNSRLTLEAFFTVPGGFEEPKRTPAKKKTDA